MEITRNVIIDLLPLYMAGEASKDTTTLIEKYLEKDSELARLAKRTRLLDDKSDIPVPLSQDKELEAYREAQTLIKQRTLIWGAMIALAVLAFLGIASLLVFTFVSAP